MPAADVQPSLLAVFIKFRDFLVTFGPWIALALISGAGAAEVLRFRQRSGVAVDARAYVLAGLVGLLPSLFGTLQFDLRLGLLRAGLATVALTGFFRVTPEAGRLKVAEEWAGPLNGEPALTSGLGGQARALWNALGERFEAAVLWFVGGCLAAGVLAIFLPWQVGFDLFGRTAWVGALLGAVVGRTLRPGTGMDLPLASLVLLKGGGEGAAAALLLASAPLPDSFRRPRGRYAVAVGVLAAAALGGWAGPHLL